MWAIFIGSHLTREPTASPVLAKWWNLELMLATNFGNLCQMVTKVSSKNFGYQIWFCTRLTIFKVSEWFCIYLFLSEGSLVWFIAASGIQYDAPLALWKTILSDALYWNLHRWVEMCNAEKEITLLLSLFSKRNYNRHPIPHGRAMAFVSSVPDLSSVLLTKALYAIMAIQCYNEPCYSSTQLYVDFFL